PQVNFAIEQLIDECAEAINIDPIDFRRNNLLRQNSITITGQKLDNHEVTTHEVLNKVLENSGYNSKLKQCGKFTPGKHYGIGLSITYRGCSLGAEGVDFCSAIINAQFDGSILLEVGIHENGQGAESTMILLLAEHLGIKRERIRYNRSSTSHIPDGGPTVASRGTLMGGGAVVNAVKILQNSIAKTLHNELHCTVSEVSIHDDCVWGKDDSHKLIWEEAMLVMQKKRVYPFAFGTFAAPMVSWHEEKGKGKAYFTWVYSAQVTEVEVDTTTGKIKLLKIWAVHDVGKVVNPPLLAGQVFGGVMQGAGMALMEDLEIQNGRIQNLNFNKYRVPRTTDVPEIELETLDTRDPNSPSGAKGVGEPALELIAPAIANAVHNAIGVRTYSYPIKLTVKNND
ncbi:MAG: molybdopterin-dependent oxidoreductase, partial [Candidatus Cloacimonetes bacterium]|nr:molybdopterin-dependent oxidoreductase [Candidatus Cloacimonadota bacterium]